MMNPRIERIAERVKDIMDGDDDLKVFTEKFAELILKECLTLIDDKIADLDEYAAAGDDEFIARSLGAYQAKEVIMDYFGVE